MKEENKCDLCHDEITEDGCSCGQYKPLEKNKFHDESAYVEPIIDHD